MDENLFHYHLSRQDYQELLRESQHARLVARLLRIQRMQRRMQEGAYPHWLAVVLVRLSKVMIAAGVRFAAAGKRLQEDLAKTGSLPDLPGESTRQYSYGD